MKKWQEILGVFIILGILVLIACLSGCQIGRDTARKLAIEDFKNMETAKEVAVLCIDSWPEKAGLMEGYLKGHMDELSANTLDTIKILNDLSAKDPNEITDYELGYFLGLKLQLSGDLFNKYASDILKTIMTIL